ncbi:MAG TPA: hypothetical protein PLC42_01035, partial [Parachlamydiaceae bacterium]|nr:hypothetical protein [Parachlamydiaceae bacterium]
MESFFFEFSSKYVSSTFMACYDDKINELNLIKGDYIDVNFPIIFKHEEGKKLTDILDTGYVGLFLISDKLKVFLEKNQLTGWKTFPIKIYDKKKIEISGYHGFSIIGRCKSIYYK